jgi:hypothetical protein
MSAAAAESPWLKAYELGSTDGWAIEPAPARRDWMDATFKRLAYRCLPLVTGNQAGWVIRSPCSFRAVWSGKQDNRGIRIAYDSDAAARAPIAVSHFGGGILTFVLPWLFRTSPGYGLLVRGPTNEPKEHVVALDAIVETDWAPYTFTMSWRLLHADTPVRFVQGEPICLIQPFRLDLLESFDCVIEPFTAAPEDLQQGFRDFVERRSANIAVAEQGGYETQRDYYAGRFPDGSAARYSVDAATAGQPTHRTSLSLKPFRR